MSVLIDTGTTAPVVTIDGADAAAAEEVARALISLQQGKIDDPAWVAAARRGWDQLPVALRRTVREFRRHSGSHGALLLRGLPVDEPAIPTTPIVEGSVQRSATVASAMLVMIACGLGDPAAFRAEKSGALVQDVVPVPGKEGFQGNAGSVLLSFHNENAFHTHRPDYVMLLCLRPDHDRVAGLRTACIRQVLPLLDDVDREALFSEEFVTQAPPSFGASGGSTPAHGVLSGSQDDPDLRIDFSATKPLTARAAHAQAQLQELFGAAATSVPLLPGDLAIVDNHVTVHGRSAFQPRYDGADRWLQRTFALRDLRRSRDQRPEDGYVLAN